MNASSIAVATGALFAAAAALASGRITIVSENEAAQSWQPAPGALRVVAGYPKSAPDPSRDVCITIGYLIDNEGKTSNFVAMNAWSSVIGEDKASPGLAPYVQNAAATVSLWKFAPVGKARQIYTSSSFAFAGSKALGEEEIRARCRIEDLPAFVAAAQRASRERARIATEQQTARDRMRNMGQSSY
jgi:hypothetical protein